MGVQRYFESDEWYHCFNRGVDKRSVFQDENDAKRFLMLLYLANGTKPIALYNSRKPHLQLAFETNRGKPIVAIGAYCLMPNHFHLLLREYAGKGISAFMQKVGTAYTMYFNKRNGRIGNLFLKPFRSRHIGTDRYFQRVLQYIHCNPAELYEPGWKSGKVRDIRTLKRKLAEYPYSSLPNFINRDKASPILSPDVFEVGDHPNISRMLSETRTYYADIAEDLIQ